MPVEIILYAQKLEFSIHTIRTFFEIPCKGSSYRESKFMFIATLPFLFGFLCIFADTIESLSDVGQV